MGDVYYLHGGTTKTGKRRYFVAKTIGPDGLSAMPPGFEFCESINGVVSVRRTDRVERKIPADDLTLAASAVASCGHLRHYRVEALKGEIVIFEPEGRSGGDVIAAVSRAFGMDQSDVSARVGDVSVRRRYAPVLKFVPSGEAGQYRVHRMTYRGAGGWSWPLALGSLPDLVKRFVSHLGTDRFFELL